MLELALIFFGWVYTQTFNEYASAYTKFSFQSMWQLGLGEVPVRWSGPTAKHIMQYPGCDNPSVSYMNGAVRANSVQLALSAVYLVTNNFFTRFAMALEFRSFNLQRRGLRVSTPAKASAQRETYFLQFPLGYSVPLLIYFTLLHTLLSQAIFLRRTNAIYPISFTDSDTKALGRQLNSFIGYSPLAALIFAIMLGLLVIFSLFLGLLELDWIVPCTNGDSRAISAMCHPQPAEEDAEVRPRNEPADPDLPAAKIEDTSQDQVEIESDMHLGEIRWGVTSMDIDGIGHCAFSLSPVRPPEKGEIFE